MTEQLEVEKSAGIVLALAARSESLNSDTLDVANSVQLIGLLDVDAIDGTDPTLDIKFQDTPDNGVTWFDISGLAFAQVTDTPGQQVIISTRLYTSQVRCVATIGGTDPLFTFVVGFILIKNAPAVAVSSTDANAANLTTGTIPLARISNLTNAQIAAAAAIAASKLAEDAIRIATVPISAADILAIGATPKELIAAPAAGKVIVVESILFKMVRGATPFINGGALEFRYTDESGEKVADDIPAAIVTTGGAGTEYALTFPVAVLTPVAAAAIVLVNATAVFLAGDGTAVAQLKYRICTL